MDSASPPDRSRHDSPQAAASQKHPSDRHPSESAYHPQSLPTPPDATPCGGQARSGAISTNETPDADEQARTELLALDEQLAHQAEDTIKAAAQEALFDLEGDFLSQEEITRIMAAELAAANPPADQNPPPSAPAAQTPSPAPPLPSASPPVGPGPAAPATTAVEPSRIAVPRPAEKVESARPIPPAAPAAPQEDKPALAGQVVESASLPADQAPAPGLPIWESALIGLAALFDQPFRRLPVSAKNALGVIGGLTCLAGLTIWLLSALTG